MVRGRSLDGDFELPELLEEFGDVDDLLGTRGGGYLHFFMAEASANYPNFDIRTYGLGQFNHCYQVTAPDHRILHDYQVVSVARQAD